MSEIVNKLKQARRDYMHVHSVTPNQVLIPMDQLNDVFSDPLILEIGRFGSGPKDRFMGMDIEPWNGDFIVAQRGPESVQGFVSAYPDTIPDGTRKCSYCRGLTDRLNCHNCGAPCTM